MNQKKKLATSKKIHKRNLFVSPSVILENRTRGAKPTSKQLKICQIQVQRQLKIQHIPLRMQVTEPTPKPIASCTVNREAQPAIDTAG